MLSSLSSAVHLRLEEWKRCYNITFSSQEESRSRHLVCGVLSAGSAGGNTKHLFWCLAGMACVGSIANCPLGKVLTNKNLIYFLNFLICSTATQPSPYLQKLGQSHIVPTPKRPLSATVNGAYGRTSDKPKIDPKFIADPSLWDPATPRDDSRPSRRTVSCTRRRPISAPVYKR